MIPKIIHYSWISNDEKPDKIKQCMETWKKYLPDYTFINWNKEKWEEEGINAVWLKEAYEQKKYAFCADYLRVYAVYKYGGFYLDCDVEVYKSFNELLDLQYYISLESVTNKGYLYPLSYRNHNYHFPEGAVFGAEPHNSKIKDVMDYYNSHHYEYKSIPRIMKDVWLNKYKWDFDNTNIHDSLVKQQNDLLVLMDYNFFSFENTYQNNAFYKHWFTNTWC